MSGAVDEPKFLLDTEDVIHAPGRLLLVVALPAYLVALAVLGLDPNTWEGGEISERLLEGDGFAVLGADGSPEPTANQEPVYPLLLAAFGKWLIALQILLWLAAARLLGWLAHRLVGAPEAATALAVALWPPLVSYVLRYHPLALRSCFLVAALGAAYFYRLAPSVRRAALLGLVLGVAALVRATFFVLPLFLLPWAMRSRWRHACLCLAMTVVVVSPWVIRNRIVLDAWAPGTTTSGLMALAGNHAGATGVLDDASLGWVVRQLPQELWFRPEPERDRFFRTRAISFCLDRPGEASLLYLKKLLYLWTWRPGVGSRYPPGSTFAYLALWIVALPALLAGAWIARRDAHAEAPLLFLGTSVVMSLVYAMFAVNMRFRFESEPLLVPYIVVAATAVVARVRRT